MNKWNVLEDPISSRLRNNDELNVINNNKTMIYHENTGTTGLILDIWKVPPLKGQPDTIREDRYVEYATESGVNQEFSIDLDEEGWLWLDELEEIK